MASTRGCQQSKGGGTQSGFVNVDVADSTCSPASFDGTISPVGGINQGINFGTTGATLTPIAMYTVAGVVAVAVLAWAAVKMRRG